MFQVQNHRLWNDGEAVASHPSPNTGGKLKPRYCIIHFTAGRDFASSVKWLSNPQAKASAHLVVGRGGEVAQLVDFDVVAWHAGKSSWLGLDGLNRHSIGIEIDNAGRLIKRADGTWESWFKATYPPSDVVLAKHRNESAETGWHVYTPLQVEVVEDIVRVLHAAYEFDDILGHEEISPKRKVDPGPAFPLDSMRSRILGRNEV